MLSRNHLAMNKWTAKVNFFLVASLSLGFFGIHGQLDGLGFISIDCGYTGSSNYTDSFTGITYVSDEVFTDSGLVHSANMGNMEPGLAMRYLTVRFFPSGTRNCYTLRSLTPGDKYLVRAVFVYGNYDTLSMLPTFDLYLGVNYWTTVSIISSSTAYIFEVIIVSPANFLHVCLMNKGLGTPFISGLDLRSLPSNFYPDSNATHSLVLLSFFRDSVASGSSRYHFGTDHYIGYPDDRYDRRWQSYEDVDSWTMVDNMINGTVKNYPNDTYGAPSAVMRSVSSPSNDSKTMRLWWSLLDSSMKVNANSMSLVVLYFTDVQALKENEFREFSILLDDITLVSSFRPEQMLTTVVTGTVPAAGRHAVSLEPSSKSNKPPLISAMEIYLILPADGSATYSGDAGAMMTIKTKYSVNRSWAGDPCLPVGFPWDGLNCTYNTSGLSRIIALYLSSNKLSGEIDPSFGKLTLLQHLDLSHNNLSGSIPNFLGELPSLAFLDLSGNRLSGPIPTSLLQKSQDGSLTLRTQNNPNLCTNPASCDPVPDPNQKKTIVKIVTSTVTVGITLLALFVAFTVWYKRKRTKVQGRQPVMNGGEKPQPTVGEQGLQSIGADHQGTRSAGFKQDQQPLLRDNMPTGLQFRNFTYKELDVITGRFGNKIAEGGFGPVYAGRLDSGTPVAVKMRSQDSSQGDKEFWAEVKHLAMLRHNNLVPLLGYCKDDEHLGLVYEYMAGGNVEQRLRGGTIGQEAPLTWSQRLKIARDSAHGLHYLHSALSTPLIHRDVKARNILLTEKLEAKISDLGLARAISTEGNTHTITGTLSGTPGYVDPEYLKAGELRGKTDVYSFGIVLLVLITARPTTVVVGNKHVNIADWVRDMLSQGASAGSHGDGDMSSIIDHSIRVHCDLVSARKVVELALRCAQREDVHARPTMEEVVAELEALQQPDDWASTTGTSGCSAMAEEEDHDETAVAGVHEVIQLAEAQ